MANSKRSGKSSASCSAAASSRDTGPTLFAMTTSAPSAPTTSNPSTSSAAGSLVRTSRSLGSVLASRAHEAVCGASISASFASFDPATWSLRTSQLSLAEVSAPSSVILPRAGMMLSGSLFELPTLERHTDASGCSLWGTPRVGIERSPARTYDRGRGNLEEQVGAAASDVAMSMGGTTLTGITPQKQVNWPTPNAGDAKSGRTPESLAIASARLALHGSHKQVMLRDVQCWPTPTTRDHKDGDCRDADVETNALLGRATVREPGAPVGALNPAWVESLMGFPAGWTDGPPVPAKHNTAGKPRASRKASRTEAPDSRPSATPSSPPSPTSSDASCGR